jgi:hypothetical protein
VDALHALHLGEWAPTGLATASWETTVTLGMEICT